MPTARARWLQMHDRSAPTARPVEAEPFVCDKSHADRQDHVTPEAYKSVVQDEPTFRKGSDQSCGRLSESGSCRLARSSQA